MMNLADAAAALGVSVPLHQADAAFSAVSTDSRSIAAGELFVALQGERFDGHGYVTGVIAGGAVGAVVTHEFAAAHPDLPLIAVADPRRALGQLAAHWRKRFNIPVIGVVGSNGKTTVKEMCAAILRTHYGDAAVLATAGNLNNDIGLPTMVLRLRDTHRVAVLEIGMNHPGETAELAAIARPTVALINNAQREHQEFMKSVQAVAEEHAALIDALPHEGIASFSADDFYGSLWRSHAGDRAVIAAGIDVPAEVCGRYQQQGFGGTLLLSTPFGDARIVLGIPGRHNARNASIAAAATLAAGVSLDSVVAGLQGFAGVKGRLYRRTGQQGALVIDDTYNANPDSMRAAVDVLASVPGKRIFVMGDMGEVGDQAGQYHDEIGGYAKSHGIDRLLCLGEHAAAAAHNFGSGATHFDDIVDLIKTLKAEVDAQTTVLVKGSRFMRMERVVEAVAEAV
jgi:UDP-N-acetylmuramoyl-tripeptide--D-alanyl-D-alanine ligase